MRSQGTDKSSPVPFTASPLTGGAELLFYRIYSVGILLYLYFTDDEYKRLNIILIRHYCRAHEYDGFCPLFKLFRSCHVFEVLSSFVWPYSMRNLGTHRERYVMFVNAIK
jgi:hypothetical protein